MLVVGSRFGVENRVQGPKVVSVRVQPGINLLGLDRDDAAIVASEVSRTTAQDRRCALTRSPPCLAKCDERRSVFSRGLTFSLLQPEAVGRRATGQAARSSLLVVAQHRLRLDGYRLQPGQ